MIWTANTVDLVVAITSILALIAVINLIGGLVARVIRDLFLSRIRR